MTRVKLLVAVLVTLLVACNPAKPTTPATQGPPAQPSEPPSPQVITAQAQVTAAQGGSVTSSQRDLSLAIPAGALAQDTSIEITHYVFPSSEAGPGAGEVRLEPSGLSFQKPASLSIVVPQGIVRREELAVYAVSAANTPVRVGGETSYFQKVTDFSYDAQSRTLQVPVQHFSVINWFREKDVYIVFDISGEYLKKGDLIYTLTGRVLGDSGASWVPGHAGLYLGAKDPLSKGNDGSTIIESTPKSLELGQPEDGVQFSDLAGFRKLMGQHIYMGARRPFFNVTDEQRDKIAAWAVGKRGTPYLTLGGPFGSAGVGSAGISCVGLTEGAYEAGAGRKIVPTILRPLLMPITQYSYTSPVNVVEVSPGKLFDMKVRGVVKAPGMAGDYWDDAKFYSLSMAADPGHPSAEDVGKAISAGRAKFLPQLDGYFSFAPTAKDAGGAYKFVFTVDASKSGLEKVSLPLYVYVREAPPTAAPPAAKLPGRIYLGATPYQKEDRMNHGLYVITPNADQKSRLISPRAIDGVAISPDGTKLAAGMLQETGQGPGDPQLAIFDAKDPAYKPLRSVFTTRPGTNSGPEQLARPSWAGDSTMLALERVGDIHLYQYAEDKSQDKVTFWAVWEGSSPTWSPLPKDNRLVVVGKSGDGLYLLDDATKGAYQFNPKYEIWAKEASQGFRDLRQGAVKKIEGSPSGASRPKWSRDGKSIVFTLKGVVQVMPVSGGDPKALTPADWKASAPVYSPDGAYIAFARLEAEPSGGIWAMKADGTEPRQVVKTDLSHIFNIDLAWGP